MMKGDQPSPVESAVYMGIAETLKVRLPRRMIFSQIDTDL